jgi:hypothetical protein
MKSIFILAAAIVLCLFVSTAFADSGACAPPAACAPAACSPASTACGAERHGLLAEKPVRHVLKRLGERLRHPFKRCG